MSERIIMMQTGHKNIAVLAAEQCVAANGLIEFVSQTFTSGAAEGYP